MSFQANLEIFILVHFYALKLLEKRYFLNLALFVNKLSNYMGSHGALDTFQRCGQEMQQGVAPK